MTRINVHNHGPHQGQGTLCPEQLIGECQMQALREQAQQAAIDDVIGWVERTLTAYFLYPTKPDGYLIRSAVIKGLKDRRQMAGYLGVPNA